MFRDFRNNVAFGRFPDFARYSKTKLNLNIRRLFRKPYTVGAECRIFKILNLLQVATAGLYMSGKFWCFQNIFISATHNYVPSVFPHLNGSLQRYLLQTIVALSHTTQSSRNAPAFRRNLLSSSTGLKS